MGVESKIKTRLYWSLLVVFVLLAILVGLVKALVITVALFAGWKAYGWFKLHQFWKQESAQSKVTIDYVAERLNEGASSDNLWIRYLATSVSQNARANYRVELMAAAKVVEARGGNLSEGWRLWFTERVHNHVEAFYDTMRDRVSVGKIPTTVFELVAQKVDLELDVAQRAFTFLGVTDASAVDQCVNALCDIRAKRLTDFIVAHLDDPSKNTSAWSEHLRKPENVEFALRYRESLTKRAEELRLNTLVTAQIKSWRKWGATRIEDYVLDPEDEPSLENVSKSSPIDNHNLLVHRAAFEVIIAEEALRLLNVINPRAAVSTMIVSIAENRADYVAVNRQEFESELLWFMACKLSERKKSDSLWVRALASNEMNTQQPSYPDRVLASEKTMRATVNSDSESWRLWGATRIEANVLDLDEDTLESRAAIARVDNPTFRELMTSRTAFEELVAEHALALLDIPDPHAAIGFLAAERGLSRATERAARLLAELQRPAHRPSDNDC
ncbi:hypothetical protein EDE15_4208 [Edaphobacter aggregans]|uniref:Uncharacterized protein n=1 Tax=Edaphobacter aggregans TaxID=570835 RepID=A0A428MNW1_9BACT|nr:hypothetical protein [Edaphobacter aggregans]RSL18618.1 hypothetical protein EDE15_4208 [Edaphobacter aggregans]